MELMDNTQQRNSPRQGSWYENNRKPQINNKSYQGKIVSAEDVRKWEAQQPPDPARWLIRFSPQLRPSLHAFLMGTHPDVGCDSPIQLLPVCPPSLLF